MTLLTGDDSGSWALKNKKDAFCGVIGYLCKYLDKAAGGRLINLKEILKIDTVSFCGKSGDRM